MFTLRAHWLLAASLLLSLLVSQASFAANPRVALETTLGTIVVELDEQRAPISSSNFLKYVDQGFYSGIKFHRVIPNFMVQAGGFDKDMGPRMPTLPSIENEADNGLRNTRGTIAMARTSDPHSASAQFFINVKNNLALNHTSKTPRGWGYAVFGKVVEGMSVVDRIEQLKTTSVGRFRDVPVDPVVINSASRIAE